LKGWRPCVSQLKHGGMVEHDPSAASVHGVFQAPLDSPPIIRPKRGGLVRRRATDLVPKGDVSSPGLMKPFRDRFWPAPVFRARKTRLWRLSGGHFFRDSWVHEKLGLHRARRFPFIRRRALEESVETSAMDRHCVVFPFADVFHGLYVGPVSGRLAAVGHRSLRRGSRVPSFEASSLAPCGVVRPGAKR